MSAGAVGRVSVSVAIAMMAMCCDHASVPVMACAAPYFHTRTALEIEVG